MVCDGLRWFADCLEVKILRKNEYDLLMDPLGGSWSSVLGGPGLRVRGEGSSGWIGPPPGPLTDRKSTCNLSSNANFILSNLQMNMQMHMQLAMNMKMQMHISTKNHKTHQ